MISANGGLPAHRYTLQVTPGWPRGSEPASKLSFEDFSLFEYSNLRLKIFFKIFRAVLRSWFRRTQLLPQRHDHRQEHLPKVVHNWLSTQRRSVQRIRSPQYPPLAVWMTC